MPSLSIPFGFIDPDLIQMIAVAIAVGTFVVHVACASAVSNSIHRLDRTHGLPPLLLPTPVWVFATLLGGIFTLAIFWLMHFSTLQPNVESMDKVQ